MILKSKDLLGLRDVSKEEIKGILDTARTMKLIIQSNTKKTPHL
ncbi:MAG TPA: aspartate carbamoyltransferase, partial [Clostridiales bacterium]|nr:aspartate carbamoyltransferase [Clostridiales bacterium]